MVNKLHKLYTVTSMAEFIKSKSVCCGSVMVRASDLWLKDRGFDSWPFHLHQFLPHKTWVVRECADWKLLISQMVDNMTIPQQSVHILNLQQQQNSDMWKVLGEHGRGRPQNCALLAANLLVQLVIFTYSSNPCQLWAMCHYTPCPEKRNNIVFYITFSNPN